MSLIIDYPWYFVVLCLLLGAAYSVVLYYIGRHNGRGQSFSRRVVLILSVLRTLAVSAIAFLLLSPLVKRESSRKEKPIVIVAEDVSKSLDYCKDSAYYAGEYRNMMDRIVDQLSKDFEVRHYVYGGGIAEYDENTIHSGVLANQTDMASALNELADMYYHRNVGAVVMTGDGIYNAGQNPIGPAETMGIPVYTVAMGDTTVYRDATIANIRANRIAYLGNEFPIEITMGASRLTGEKAKMSVLCEGRTLWTKEININESHFSTTESITLTADKSGVHNYVVEIAPMRDEQTLRNNRRVVTVEVIDGHQKVAIIYAVPHPDVAALQRAIGQNQNFEVETFLARDFNKNPRDYDLLVLHQLPTKVSESAIDVARLIEKGTPALFVVGSLTDLARLNTLHAGLEIHARIDRQNEVSALKNKDFSFFTMPDDASAVIEKFPPLVAPFGEYKLSGSSQTLFVAKLGNVNSGMPLIAVSQQGEHRYGFIAGEGLWRWRLADYQANQSHDNFDLLIDKLVTFTSLRLNKEKFHIESKSLYGGSESVTLEAQLYNDNYEPVNTPDVELTVSAKGEGSTGAKHIFNRSGVGYSINLGILDPGVYNYYASVQFNGKKYSASGSFAVEDLQLEAMNLVADHSLMATIASITGGEMVDAHEVESIVEMILNRDNIKTLIYSETRYSNMLNMPWIFIFIVLLLGCEWVIRKYNGEI